MRWRAASCLVGVRLGCLRRKTLPSEEELNRKSLEAGRGLAAFAWINPDILVRGAVSLRAVRLKLAYVEEQLGTGAIRCRCGNVK